MTVIYIYDYKVKKFQTSKSNSSRTYRNTGDTATKVLEAMIHRRILILSLINVVEQVVNSSNSSNSVYFPRKNTSNKIHISHKQIIVSHARMNLKKTTPNTLKDI